MTSAPRPSAQAFERLVVEDILPTIRRTGRYGSYYPWRDAPVRPLDITNLIPLRERRAYELALSLHDQILAYLVDQTEAEIEAGTALESTFDWVERANLRVRVGRPDADASLALRRLSGLLETLQRSHDGELSDMLGLAVDLARRALPLAG